MNHSTAMTPSYSHDQAIAAAAVMPEVVFNPVSSVDFGTLLRILRRNLWWILLTTIVATIVTGVVLHFIPPRYEAEATLQISQPPAPLLSDTPTVGQQMTTVDDLAVNSEADAVLSLPVLQAVIQQLKLDQDPEFNPALKGDDRSDLWPPAAAVLNALQAVQMRIMRYIAPNPQSFPQNDQRLIEDNLRRAVSVSVKGDSRVLVIQAKSLRADKAAAIANAIAAAFIANRRDAKLAYTQQLTGWLNVRLNELRDKVTQSEQEVAQLRASMGAYQGQTAEPLLSEQLSQITRQLLDAQAEQSQAQAKVGQLSNMTADRIGAADGVLASPLITSLREQRAELDTQRSEEMSRLGPKHPFIRSINSQLSQIDHDINTQISRISQNASEQLREDNARVAALQQSKAEIERRINVQNAQLVRLNQVKATADSDRKAYEAFAIYRDKLTGANQVEQPEAELLSPAAAPVAPAYPKQLMALGIVAFVTLFLTMTTALLRQSLDDRFRNPQDVSAVLGLPTLAVIPRTSHRFKTDAAVAEGIRYLYAELEKKPQSPNAPLKVLFSSALPREGKTTVATMLAREAASDGRLTLLIDLDIRQQFMARDVDGEPITGGLQTMRASPPPFEPSLHVESDTGLTCLSFKTALSQPFKLLYTQQFWRDIAKIMSRFDLVVIDSPPILSVPDAKVIAGYVDLTVFLVKWGATTRNAAAEGIRHFRAIGASICGVVLTQVQQKRYPAYERDYIGI